MSTHSLSLSLSLLTYRCVYERSPIAPTLVTFTLSAIWHGFYPGYYFTFIFFGIETEAARKVQYIHVTCKPNNYYAMITDNIILTDPSSSLALFPGQSASEVGLPCGHMDCYQDVAGLWYLAFRVYVGESWSAFLGVSFKNTLHIPPISTYLIVFKPLKTHRFYYYIPVVAVCVVAFLFPSGRSSGQKIDPVTTANHHNSINDVMIIDKKTN